VADPVRLSTTSDRRLSPARSSVGDCSGESQIRDIWLRVRSARIVAVRQAIGNVLALAIAAAISPFPIIGVVLMLITPRARINGPMFILGWLVGLAVVGAVGLTVASAAGASDHGAPSTTANLVQILLGSVLVIFAVRQWGKRPKPGAEAIMPKWMSAVDDFAPRKAATTGFVLSAVNPKNLILTLAAAMTIAATNLPGSDQVIAFIVYALIATTGVAVPVLVFFILGDRSRPVLENLKTWFVQHNAAIMAVIFLVIGAKILGQGIAG
jgi:threonine/homoserine/homoserine lactone efflux protein